MLYSIVPEEQILEGWEEDNRSYLDVEIPGGVMQVEPLDYINGRVVRLISSDPQLYLDTNYQPGTVVRLG